ncbi:UNVERIFIED_CONTAM: hypothetical protein GTU68_057287 [Idotea baltica]|nr:hypothetical protein [Idotea baltica]
MRALVKAEPAPGLTLQDMPVPDVGTDDVLVKIHRTGICGTDMHIWNWDAWASKTVPVPLIVGHEYSGEIIAVGSHVRDLDIGQRVTGEGHVIGHRSRAVRAGKYHLDPDTKGIGVNIPGAFADYLSLPAFQCLLKSCPDDMIDETAAHSGSVGNAVHTQRHLICVGEDVL